MYDNGLYFLFDCRNKGVSNMKSMEGLTRYYFVVGFRHARPRAVNLRYSTKACSYT